MYTDHLRNTFLLASSWRKPLFLFIKSTPTPITIPIIATAKSLLFKPSLAISVKLSVHGVKLNMFLIIILESVKEFALKNIHAKLTNVKFVII